MPLSKHQKKHYKTIGHSLKPVIIVAGNRLSEGVFAEIERALDDHELIKIKLATSEHNIRKQVAKIICDQTGATIVQEIGKVLLVFRAAKKPNPKLSNLMH